MKNIIKLFGIIALVAVLGFSMAACDNGTGSSIDESALNQVRYVAENPTEGFNYGYYYYIPQSIRNASKKYLLVEPNNTGGYSGYDMDDAQTHSQAAQGMLNYARRYADELGCVLLVPVIPRPYRDPPLIEPQILNRVALQTNTGKPARVDLQLIAMIDDVKALCRSIGVNLERKILIEGFSAGGAFGNRFTALHPELVQAVVSGGMNGLPILPIDTMEDERLIYPVGIADLEEITDTPFNFAEYVKVPQFIYMGSVDTNDNLPAQICWGSEERRIITKVLGSAMQVRWPNAISVYEAQNCSAVTFKTYSGVGHEIPYQIQRDIVEFLGKSIGVHPSATKFEGTWVNTIAITNYGYNEFSWTFNYNQCLFRSVDSAGMLNSWPGTFTFTDTTITFIPAQLNTWDGYTQGYTLSGNQLELANDGQHPHGVFVKQ